jgi:uridylate kinase
LKVAISVGGSIFSRDEGIEVEYVKEFSKTIKELSRKHEIYIVAGGGKTARRFIAAGRALGANEDFLDLLGIMATRLNAMVISASLREKGLNFVPERVEEADKVGGDKVFVMGGTVPGHSTDAVSAMLAAHVGADLLINATNVDGVYEMDPKKDPKARRFDRLSHAELLKIVKRGQHEPGASAVLDMKAAKIILENNIKTVVIDGRNVKNISDAIEGKVTGTIIEK